MCSYLHLLTQSLLKRFLVFECCLERTLHALLITKHLLHLRFVV